MDALVRDASLLQRVREIRADPAQPLRTESLAQAAGLPPPVFIRRFKRLTGLSPLRFRAALRMEAAKALLARADRSVTDISLEVGYSSLGTFVRTFTLMVGLSPTRFRALAASVEPPAPLSAVPPRRPAPRPGGGGGLAVRFASIPPGADLTVAAGLFPEAVPAGWPIDGRLQIGVEAFRLDWPTGLRRASLLVVALPRKAEASALWAPRPADLLVFARELRRDPAVEDAGVTVALRRLRETDPPILIPFPMLLGGVVGAPLAAVE